jgi:transposase
MTWQMRLQSARQSAGRRCVTSRSRARASKRRFLPIAVVRFCPPANVADQRHPGALLGVRSCCRSGPANIAALIATIQDDRNPLLPQEARPALLILVEQLHFLNQRIAAMEKEATATRRLDDRVKRLMSIPGIGIITATAIAATVPDAKAFRSGREFAAWIGLVPRQQSSGGKERLGGHTKMGDSYLRRLLISGAQAVIAHSSRRKETAATWLGALIARKPRMVAAVALANKTARIAWVIMARGEHYRAMA